MGYLSSFVPGIVADHPAATAVVVLVGLYIFLAVLVPYKERRLAFYNVPGRPAPSLLLGHLKELFDRKLYLHPKEWFETYGLVVRHRILLTSHRLTVADPRAAEYVMQHTDKFERTEETSRQLGRVFGQGILTVDGPSHERQRRLIAPAFGPKGVRDAQDTIWDKAYELTDKMEALLDDESIQLSPSPAMGVDKVSGTRKMDVMKYIGQGTLDAIGLIGFSYDFGSLKDVPDALAESFTNIWNGLNTIVLAALVNLPIEYFPSAEAQVIARHRKKTILLSEEIVKRKKAEIQAEFDGHLDKHTRVGSDLISILIRANMAADLKAEQRLSDSEMRDQITNLMLAGNDTSATALTWGLYRLCQHPEYQTKLREEVMSVGERVDYDTLNKLPFLDKVVREVLRYDPPVGGVPRTCIADCVIPLDKPIVGRDGKPMDGIPFSKGDQLILHLAGLNRCQAVWGPDGEEFKPERWSDNADEIPSNTKVPGIYPNISTFYGGPYNCLGWRYAVTLIKTYLFAMIRRLEFEELPSKPDVYVKLSIIIRPYLPSEKQHGLQMPLLVRRVRVANGDGKVHAT